MPEHGLVHLLELQKEELVIVEVQIDGGSPAAGKSAGGLALPEGSRLISVIREGRTELVEAGPAAPGRPGARDRSDEPGGGPAPRASRRAQVARAHSAH